MSTSFQKRGPILVSAFVPDYSDQFVTGRITARSAAFQLPFFRISGIIVNNTRIPGLEKMNGQHPIVINCHKKNRESLVGMWSL
jgi:hypothetical protein